MYELLKRTNKVLYFCELQDAAYRPMMAPPSGRLQMSAQSDKTNSPAYGSFRTLITFLNDIREGGGVPQHIDRNMMAKFSGSAKAELMSGLRFLGLIDGDGRPSNGFERLTMASDEDRKQVLDEILRTPYAFVFEAPNVDLARASSQQVADLFRAQSISGSTLARAMTFFLAASKEAGIKVSHHVKPPQTAKTGAGRVRKEKLVDPPTSPTPPTPPSGRTFREKDDEDPDVHRFQLPIPGKPSVEVLIPKSLDSDDWDMFKTMFNIYVERWKKFKASENSAAEEDAE
jgi:hypothetical protein